MYAVSGVCMETECGTRYEWGWRLSFLVKPSLPVINHRLQCYILTQNFDRLPQIIRHMVPFRQPTLVDLSQIAAPDGLWGWEKAVIKSFFALLLKIESFLLIMLYYQEFAEKLIETTSNCKNCRTKQSELSLDCEDNQRASDASG